MTKKEAIAHLYTHSSTNGSGQTTQAQHEEAKRMAIEALLQQSEIIHCKDCVHHIDGFFCRQANHHTSDSDHCASVFGAERRRKNDQRRSY